MLAYKSIKRAKAIPMLAYLKLKSTRVRETDIFHCTLELVLFVSQPANTKMLYYCVKRRLHADKVRTNV